MLAFILSRRTSQSQLPMTNCRRDYCDLRPFDLYPRPLTLKVQVHIQFPMVDYVEYMPKSNSMMI